MSQNTLKKWRFWDKPSHPYGWDTTRQDSTQCAEASKLNMQCSFWDVGKRRHFSNSCLIGQRGPQVYTLSEQCALHSAKVNYAIKCFRFTNVWNISTWTTSLCKQLENKQTDYFHQVSMVWFGVLKNNAITWFVHLTGIHLSEVLCRPKNDNNFEEFSAKTYGQEMFGWTHSELFFKILLKRIRKNLKQNCNVAMIETTPGIHVSFKTSPILPEKISRQFHKQRKCFTLAHFF